MVKKIDKDVFRLVTRVGQRKRVPMKNRASDGKKGDPGDEAQVGVGRKGSITLKKKKESEWYPTDLVVLPQYWEEQNHRISKSNNLLNKSFIHHRSKLRHTRAVKLTNG